MTWLWKEKKSIFVAQHKNSSLILKLLVSGQLEVYLHFIVLILSPLVSENFNFLYPVLKNQNFSVYGLTKKTQNVWYYC